MTRIDYNTPVETIRGESTTLDSYRGKVLLIVNTASKCGLTPQYSALEVLHKGHSENGLAILGFPCNQFGQQEPGDNASIEDFCTTRFQVSFDMFAKITVNGEHTHPLYVQLKNSAPGLLNSKGIKWNFTKFLVGRDGTIIKRYSPTTTPASIEDDILREISALADQKPT